MDKILQYLCALEQNNNQEWFHANKQQYQEATSAFEDLVERLTVELAKRDGSIPLTKPKELTFKLMRDTRFSNDKSPYLPAFRAHIGPKGKLPIPVGYYIMIKPGHSFLGGGLFADMFKDATAMIRDYIVTHGEQWEQILADPGFTAHFKLGGSALKNVPRGYDPTHPQAEYLKYKSWYLEYPISDQQLCEEGFLSQAVELFTVMQPFNSYLNRALATFEMPKR